MSFMSIVLEWENTQSLYYSNRVENKDIFLVRNLAAPRTKVTYNQDVFSEMTELR